MDDGRTLLMVLTAEEAIALARKHGSGPDSFGAHITAVKNCVGRDAGAVIQGVEMTGKQYQAYLDLSDGGVMRAKVEARARGWTVFPHEGCVRVGPDGSCTDPDGCEAERQQGAGI